MTTKCVGALLFLARKPMEVKRSPIREATFMNGAPVRCGFRSYSSSGNSTHQDRFRSVVRGRRANTRAARSTSATKQVVSLIGGV